MILPGADSHAIAQAAQRIRAGQLVGLPTETVYGLAADACNDHAVASIFAAKGRPADHPLIVHIASISNASIFASHVPDFAHALMHAFWPGPLTLILPRRAGVASAAATDQDAIGLRCPAHPVAQALLHACRELGVQGLAAPSANRFGRISPTTAAHVQEELGEQLLVLDGGACQVGIESSIVDCTRGRPVLLRPGVLARAQLQAVCGRPVRDTNDPSLQPLPSAPRASGTLAAHYAPRAQLRVMPRPLLQAALAASGPQLQGLAVYAREPLPQVPQGVLLRTMPAEASACAQELFAVLRELDAQGVQQIWVEEVPQEGAWDGVRDRLQRAAS